MWGGSKNGFESGLIGLFPPFEKHNRNKQVPRRPFQVFNLLRWESVERLGFHIASIHSRLLRLLSQYSFGVRQPWSREFTKDCDTINMPNLRM